jgi:hypothetical protein
MVLIGGVEEEAAIQCEKSMWMRKRYDEKFFEGHVRKRDDERSLGDQVNWEGLSVIIKGEEVIL